MKKHLLLIPVLVFIGSSLVAQTILGVDVSHYEGTINWSQVSAAGKVFAWAKATEGTSYTDPNFSTYMPGGVNAGVVMGAYHFARPESNAAVDEANHFLAVASSYIGTGFLPPVLDLEDPPTGPSLSSSFSSAALTTWVQTWLTTVQNQTGIAPVIYTSASYAGYLNSSLNIYKLWIANPGTSATTAPTNIGNWTTWAFKQYDWNGTVSGISSAVDLDVFHGTLADFNNLVGTSPCTAPSNDNCPGTPITSNGACLTGTVACATGSYGANQCAGCACSSPDDYDVYYSFTAAATSHTVTLSNYASDFDAVMELRNACALGSGNFISCFDSSGIPTSVSHTWSNLNIGQTYYIRIFEYNYSGSPPSSPTFDICVTHSTCTAPAQPGSISGTTSFCSGTSQTFSINAVSGATSYTWTYSGTGAPSGTGTSITFSPTTSGILSVKANNSCGSSTTSTLAITVNQAPVQPGTISGSTSFCSGASETYAISAVSGATGYTWSYTGSGTPSGNGTSITFTPTSSGTLSVVANGTCGNSTARTLSLNVSQSPGQPSSINGNTLVCANSSQTYSISAVNGATSYSWAYSGSGSPAGTGTSVTFSVGNAGTLSVIASNGCGNSTADTLGISTNSAPAQPGNISGNISVCSGTSQTYTISAVSGATGYSWYFTGSGTPTGSDTTVTFNPTNTGALGVTANNSCGSSSQSTLTVTVNQVPVISVTPSFDTICLGGTGVQLYVNGAAQNYSWSPALGLNSTTGQTVTANPTSNSIYTVTATNGNCLATATASVYVSNSASVVFNPVNPAICLGGSVGITALPTGTAYSWSGPNGFISGSQTINVSATGNYHVTITNAAGCAGTITSGVIVSQNPQPIINAGADKNIYVGDSVLLGGSPTATAGTPPYFYSWSPANSLNNSSVANPVAFPIDTTIYNLLVTDSNGCTATDSVTVNVSVACSSYALDSQNITVSPNQGNYHVLLTTNAGCPWSVNGSCNWLSFLDTSGHGSSTISFAVQENLDTNARTCTMNIAGLSFMVTQQGAAPCYAPIADFYAVNTAGFAPLPVQFYDSSANGPTQWQWSFPGGNPSSSTIANPLVTYFSPGIYDVNMLATNGCGSNYITKSNYINVLTTGIEEIPDLKNVSVYPNPNTGVFTVAIQTTVLKTVTIDCFNTLLQNVYTKELSLNTGRTETQLDLSLNAKGIYFLRITSGGKSVSCKVTIIE